MKQGTRYDQFLKTSIELKQLGWILAWCFRGQIPGTEIIAVNVTFKTNAFAGIRTRDGYVIYS